MDLIQALYWVKANIKAFGGDPENVTIAGESAGGQNVISLITSPLAKNLFHRAISQSGTVRAATSAQGAEHANEIIRRLLVKDGSAPDGKAAGAKLENMAQKDIENYLRSKTAQEFLELYPEGKLIGMISFPNSFRDGAVLPVDFYGTLKAGNFNKGEVSQNITKVKSLEAPYQFAVLGDSQDGDKIYQRLLRHILQRRPDFIIHVGDMISQPGEKEWKTFFEISKESEIPFFPVVGNHEVAGTSRGEEIFRKQFQLPERKTYYSFQAGERLFVVLNSERGKGKIIDDQWNWLSSLLSSSKEKFKMVFLHRPIFPPPDSFKWGRGMDR